MTIDNGIRIEGRGGKDSGSTPSEDRDSLRSTQIADVLDLISEGECQGLKNGLKSLFLDGVPYQNDDDSFNFTGLDFAWTVGSQGQAALPGMPGVQSEHIVGVSVHAGTPIVRTVSSSAVDSVRVTIGVPQLSNQDMESGDLHGSSFEFAIDVQSNGGGYNERYRRIVTGKNMSMYTRSVIVPLSGGAPYDIRVRRITPDSTSSTVVNAFSWISYTEIQSIKLRYPNSALALLRVDAKQFSRVPVRSYHWLGVRVQVPNNYDPIARTYTGTWDGTFKIAWTNNPAWCLYAMITNPRYGLGSFVDPALNNKWVLYKIGQYCDGMVPDGKGGTEPRFTFNYQFTTRAEAYKVLRDMSAVFRGLLYWSNGSVEYSQDAPADAELLYTPSNVENGVFTYEDTSEKSLHSVFIAYWNDLSQQGKRVPEVYAPDDLIARYGVREMAMELLGCTSRGQAARMCRWARYSEQHEGTLVSFKVGSDGQVCAPGKLFQIADPSEAGERLGGRIKAATTASVTLDAAVELRTGETYTLTIISPKAGEQLATVTEQRTVTTLASTTDTLTVSPAFSQAPAAETIWILQSNAVAATWWRCLGVKEVAGKNQYVITGVAHHPGKYDEVELGLTLDETPISRLTAVVTPPTDLQLLETVYTDGTTNRSRLTASWVPSAANLQHTVYWRRDSSWWQTLPPTGAQTVDIGPLDPGVYEVKVTSTNPLGNTSLAAQNSITIAGGPSGVRAVRLKASSTAFKVTTSNSPTPSSIQITADQGGLIGDITWSLVSGVATLTGTGNTRTLAYTGMSTESVTISATVVDKGQTFSDLITIIKVRDGNPGTPGATGATGATGAPGANGTNGAPATNAVLSLDVIALPADGAGAVTSYTGAFTTLVIWAGDTIDSTGWTYTRTNSSGITSTLSGATLTINSVASSTDSGYVDITATRSGSASITKRVSIVKNKQGPAGATGATGAQGAAGATGAAGQRGSVQLAKEIAGSTWSDSAANAAITSAGYTSVVKLDMVTLYNSTSGFSEARFYDGASWLTINAYINGNLLVPGTVGAAQLVANSAVITGQAQLGSAIIGEAQMRALSVGAASIKDLNVTTVKIADNAVTVPDMVFSATINGVADAYTQSSIGPRKSNWIGYDLYKWNDTLVPLTNSELLAKYSKSPNPYPAVSGVDEIGVVLATAPTRDYGGQTVVIFFEAYVNINTPSSMPGYIFRVYRRSTALTGDTSYTSTSVRLAPRGTGSAPYDPNTDPVYTGEPVWDGWVDRGVVPVITSYPYPNFTTDIKTSAAVLLYDKPPPGSWTYHLVLQDRNQALTAQHFNSNSTRMFILGAKK